MRATTFIFWWISIFGRCHLPIYSCLEQNFPNYSQIFCDFLSPNDMNFLFWKESGGQSLILREEEKWESRQKKKTHVQTTLVQTSLNHLVWTGLSHLVWTGLNRDNFKPHSDHNGLNHGLNRFKPLWFKPKPAPYMIIGRWFKPGYRWRRCGLNLNHAVAAWPGYIWRTLRETFSKTQMVTWIMILQVRGVARAHC